MISTFTFGQELSKNAETGIYEFSKIINSDQSVTIETFEKKLLRLNYSDIITTENSLSSEGTFTHLVMGNFPVEIKYRLIVSFKESKHKILLTRFIVSDQKAIPVPLEDLKSHTKKWIKNINKKLPDILKALESNDNSGW